MIEIRQTVDYESWFEKLRDRQAKFRILARIRRLSLGNFGDVTQQGDNLVVLLAAGDKSSQSRDIERAKELARRL